MRITDFLKVEGIIPRLTAGTKAEVLAELAGGLARAAPAIRAERYRSVLEEREKLGSTGMEKGVAIPHGRVAELSSLVACVGVSVAGVAFDARDGRPSQFFFALVAPENSAGLHLKALSRISRLLRSEALKEGLLRCATAQQVHELLALEDARP